MKIQETLMSLLLIIGIFHHTLGYSDDEYRQMIQQKGSWISDWSRKIQEQSCQINGGPEAFESWMNSIRTINVCISNSMMGTPYANEQVSPLDILPAVMKCIEPQIESLESCEDPESRKIIDITHKLATGFMYFVGNNTEDINKMLGRWASGMKNCPLSKYRDLLVCAEDLITMSSATVVKLAIRHIHGRSGSTPSSTIGTDWNLNGFQIFDTFQTCSVKVLNECDDKLNAELVHSLFEYVNDEIPCKDFEKSHGSSYRVVNGLFLIVAAIAAIR